MDGRKILQIAALGGAAKKQGLNYRRPRHALKGRQDAYAVEVGGVWGWPYAMRRPRLAKLCCRMPNRARRSPIPIFTAPGPIVARICACRRRAKPRSLRCWEARRGDRRVSGHHQQDQAQRGFRQASQKEIDRVFGPAPAAARKSRVIVLDNGQVHLGQGDNASARESFETHRLTIEWLPENAPELNGIERLWGDMKSPPLRPPDLRRGSRARKHHPSSHRHHGQRTRRSTVGRLSIVY